MDFDPNTTSCPTSGYQALSVCVPVTVTPYVHVGETVTRCCGEPVITAGNNGCTGRRNGVCMFTIRQRLCVEVPISFGANAVAGEPNVDCLGASHECACSETQNPD